VLLEDHVEVRAAEAEGGDRGAAHAARGALPGLGAVDEEEGQLVEGDGRVRLAHVDGGRQDLVVQGEGRLEQAGRAGAALQMADLRLDRAQADAARREVQAAEGVGQGLHLGHVADAGGGAMGLDEPQGRGREAGDLVGPLERQELTRGVRGGDAFAFAVAGRADRADDRVDLLASPLRVRQAAQDEERPALPHDEPVGASVEGPAPVLGERADLGELHEGGRSHGPVHAAGDHRVDPLLGEGREGGVQSGERARAGGVGGEVDAPKVQGVGDAAGDDVAQLAGHAVLGDGRQSGADAREQVRGQRAPGRLRERGELRDLLEGVDHLGGHDPHAGALVELAAQGVAEHHADALGVHAAVGVAGVLERRAGEDQRPLLGHVHRRSDPGRDAKAGAVEAEALHERADLAVGLVDGRRLGVVVVAGIPAIDRDLADAVLAGKDVAPERIVVRRVGHDRRDAHDGCRALRRLQSKIFASH
jgi:hypothetical protein